ncbi:MAG: 50S ribosomal protein L6, partial [Thermodesulfobacteriota bacterium]
QGLEVSVTGPKGSLSRRLPAGVSVILDNGAVRLETGDDGRSGRAIWGLARTLVNNMVVGVSTGFRRRLLIEGVGYKAEAAGAILTLSLGYSQPVSYSLPAGVKAVVDKSGITLEAMDKELLGETAARIRAVRGPEPYKGKGVRYEAEYIARKVGKTGGKGGKK